MFNCDALQQLKQDMHASKELAQGLVRGTSKRFGFVVLDDGREAFLNPDEMQRVFPGDRVEVSLNATTDKNDKEKLEATLEKLLTTDLEEFVGRYIVRGKGHFVEPDVHGFNRWIFIAPNDRADALAGDYIRVRIVRHPFKYEGKAQAKILTRIGRDEDIAIEAKYTVDKFQLPFTFGDIAKEQAAELEGECFSASDKRQDLTALPFVTIDSDTTLDMDDALYAERLDSSKCNGWKLYVAIADPSSEIEINSPLDLAARARVNSVYLPGNTISMLPQALSHDTFSLVAGKARAALVCTMSISEDGTISAFKFTEALVQSKHKLSYTGVAALLNQESSEETNKLDISDEAAESLQLLSQLSYVRTRYRQDHALVMEDRPDYYPVLNDKRKIERIDKCDRTIAHALVEEAMLATNACAGDFFAEHSGHGIFSTHAGFKPERLEEVKSLLKDDRPDISTDDITTLKGYQTLISSLQRADASCVVLATLKRTLQPGQLSLEAKPHMGLGLPHYATVTSPIRRYNDLFNHQAIKNILNGVATTPLPAGTIEVMQLQISNGRQACRQMERWLYCQFMQQFVGQSFTGTVTLTTSVGLGINLDEFGIQGFCYLAADRNNKPKFDSRRMKLSHNDVDYHLEQKVDVIVDSVDLDARKINLRFATDTKENKNDI